VPEVVTRIDCVVAPLDHKYESPDDEVNVTEPPGQKVIAPLAVIVAGGGVTPSSITPSQSLSLPSQISGAPG